MAFLHFTAPRFPLSLRTALSAVRRHKSFPLHDDQLRAGQQAPAAPAFMTLLHGGRPPRA